MSNLLFILFRFVIRTHRKQLELSMKNNELKQALISQLNGLNDDQWETCNIIFQFPPTINKGYKSLPNFFDKEKNRVRFFLPISQLFDNVLYKYIQDANLEGRFNQITVLAKNRDLHEAEVNVTFNQEIVDSFENNLPKSKRGKTIPWWKNQG